MKTVEAVCTSCKGTGVYQGIGEADGAFVVCFRCKGTGSIRIEYEPFTERVEQPLCRRVYKTGMGKVITDENIVHDGVAYPFGEYGCSYEDWKGGAGGSGRLPSSEGFCG